MTAKTWFRRTFVLLIALLLLVVLLLAWSLRTESGAERLVALALSQTKAQVTVDSVSGTVAHGLTLSGVSYAADFGVARVNSIAIVVALADLLRGTLTVERIAVDTVTVTTRRGADDERTSGSEPMKLPRLDLPVDVVLMDFSVDNVRVGGEPATVTSVVEQLTARGRWIDTDLSIDALSLRSDALDLSGTAVFQTEGDYPVDIVAESTLRLPDYAALTSITRLGGTLTRLEIQHTSNAPYALSISGDITDPLSGPQMNLNVSGERTSLMQISSALPDITLSGRVDIAGTIAELSAIGRIDSTLPDYGDAAISVDAILKPGAIRLAEVTLSLPDTDGEPKIQSSGTIEISNGRPVFDLAVEWHRLRWPLRGERVVYSRTGNATITGAPDEYTAKLSGNAATRYDPDGKVELALSGNLQRISFDTLRARILEGEISGRGQLSLGSESAFSANLNGRQINPQGVSQQWPGQIDFVLSGSGRRGSDGLSIEVNQFDGEGQLRGYPVAFDGKGRVAAGQANFERFDLRTGATRIAISGAIADTVNVDWKVVSQDLGSLWPGLEGELNATGRASGLLAAPDIQASIDGKAMAYGEASVESVEAQLNYRGEQPGEAAFVVTGLALGPYQAQRLGLGVEGRLDGHTITIELDDVVGTERLVIDGALSDAGRYAFTLAAFELVSVELGTWSLAQPVSGELSADRVKLGESCLGRELSSLCISVDSAGGQWMSDLSIEDVPLSLFSHVLPSSIRASGTLNGGGSLRIMTDGTSSGSVRFDISPLTVQSRITRNAQDSTLRFGPSTIKGRVDESGTLEISGDFPLLSGGGLMFAGKMLPGAQQLLDRELGAEVSLSVPSLEFVPDYVPELSRAEGRIDGEVRVSGSVRRPELVGEFRLDQGALTLDGPGVEASDVSLTLTGKRDSSFALSGRAESGGGVISLDGVLTWGPDGNEGRVELSGQDFQVFNTREAQVWATPDVVLKLEKQAFELTGSVLIPRARIDIDELPKGTIQASKDEVIVGAETEGGQSTIPIDSTLELSLGDDVLLSAFGLDARLGGGVTITEKSGKPPTATGEIELFDGEYRAYGQQLTITTGRLIYAGGPLDSPGIDLRAIRKPAAGIEVGIAARGVISQPTFSVFSSPAMSESDQLAYLMFGRPINAEASSESALITRAALTLGMRGGDALTQRLADELGIDQLGIESEGSGDLSQASLVIGKYLSPKLFVSYGIGLLEPVSTLKLEYALSSRWHLVTESSPTRTSADAQFTYER